MESATLLEKIGKLSADQKKEVENLITVLVFETENPLLTVNVDSLHESTLPSKERMRFGDLKGFVTYISDDFDEPLEDFNDYM